MRYTLHIHTYSILCTCNRAFDNLLNRMRSFIRISPPIQSVPIKSDDLRVCVCTVAIAAAVVAAALRANRTHMMMMVQLTDANGSHI